MQQQNSVNCEQNHCRDYQSTSFEEIKKQYLESIRNRRRYNDGCDHDYRNDDDADCYCE